MFAAFYSVTAPVETLVRVAQSFSPRVEVSGRLVLCDLHGVERLFGGPRDVAEHIRRALVDTGVVAGVSRPPLSHAASVATGTGSRATRASVTVAATVTPGRPSASSDAAVCEGARRRPPRRAPTCRRAGGIRATPIKGR